jgi:hypothetical protein
MQSFTADPHNSISASACNTCCCEMVSIRPGETDKFNINYAAWSVPIGGRGLSANTAIDLVLKTPITSPVGGNQRPVPTLFLDSIPQNSSLVDSLIAIDADLNPLTFAALPLFGPSNGIVTISANGNLVYTPNANFNGYERFFFTVSDGVNNPVVQEAIIAVQPPLPATQLVVPTAAFATPKVRARPVNVVVDQIWQSISFPLEVGPHAVPGEVYRMTIRQGANDCDATPYFHVSCYDLLVGSCK